jgi:predicted ArsR family transcriptional regulator
MSTERAGCTPGGSAPAGPAEPRIRRRERRPATEAEARALASAVRLRILRLCLDRPLTNKEIALKLGANPATALHHVRTLVATGFLAAQPERRGNRGAREVPYLATGKSWATGEPESSVDGRGAAMIDAFLDEVRLIDPDHAGLARLGLRLDDVELTELRERIQEILEDFAARAPNPHGRPYSVFCAIFDDVSRD